MDSTWESRDFPVLEAIVRLYDDEGALLSPPMIGAAAGISEDDVQKALRALKHNDPPYITSMSTQGNGDVYLVGPPTGHARRTVGAWPTPENLADRIAAALNDAADQESEPERKGRLKKAADAVGGVGKDVVTRVLSEVVTRQVQGM